jgi:membrane protease YdiL (CAAX protease family)
MSHDKGRSVARRVKHALIAEGRLRSGWRVALYLFCYLLGMLGTQIPVTVLYVAYVYARGADVVSRLVEMLQPDHLAVGLVLAFKLAELAMLLPLTYVFCRFLDRRPLSGLGLGRGSGWGQEILLGLALGATQMALILGLEWAGGWLTVACLDGAALIHGLAQAGIAMALFVLVAMGEELLFRGYLQVNLGEGIGSWPALVVTSALFGVFHALNPHFGWLPLLNIALAGLAMGYGRLVSGRLWLPMAYHLSWNFFQGPVLALPVSGMRYGGLLAVADRGAAPLLTGAAFGPEGGLIGTAVLLLAFPMFWWWGRRQRKFHKSMRT